jgi:hypothetical protein
MYNLELFRFVSLDDIDRALETLEPHLLLHMPLSYSGRYAKIIIGMGLRDALRILEDEFMNDMHHVRDVK